MREFSCSRKKKRKEEAKEHSNQKKELIPKWKNSVEYY